MSSDSRYLVAAGDDCKLRVWPLQDITGEVEPMILDAGSAELTAIAVSKQGDWLAAGDAAGKAYLWRVDAAGVEPQAVALRAGDQPVTAVAFTPDGRWLVAAGDDWNARLWNLDITELAAAAELVARHEIEAAERLASQSILHQAIAAVEPQAIADSTTPGLIWSTLKQQAPRVQAGCRAWLRGELEAPAEPKIATGPRTNEVGAAEPAEGEPEAAPKPSLTVAMPAAEPEAPRPPIQHEWPVRSIVRRGSPEATPRTAAKPASTLEIHTR